MKTFILKNNVGTVIAKIPAIDLQDAAILALENLGYSLKMAEFSLTENKMKKSLAEKLKNMYSSFHAKK